MEHVVFEKATIIRDTFVSALDEVGGRLSALCDANGADATIVVKLPNGRVLKYRTTCPRKGSFPK